MKQDKDKVEVENNTIEFDVEKEMVGETNREYDPLNEEPAILNVAKIKHDKIMLEDLIDERTNNSDK